MFTILNKKVYISSVKQREYERDNLFTKASYQENSQIKTKHRINDYQNRCNDNCISINNYNGMDLTEKVMSQEAKIIDEVLEQVIGRAPISEDYRYVKRNGNTIYYLHIKLGEIETTISEEKVRSEFTPIAHIIIEE